MRKPNLFVVGAPKCATTTLHAFLAQHPECFMSAVKEPAYFSRAHIRADVRRTVPYLQSEDAYMKLFSDATNAHKVVGECSTGYMRTEADLEELRAFSGNPKIIAMVRDPASLVSSYYHFLRFQGWEPLDTLRKAWDIQNERCAGRIESFTANRPDALAYRNVALLGEQVERLFRMFGQDNVLILLTDDLRDDTANFCRAVQDFLSLTYIADIEMPYKNVARAAKVPMIDRLIKRDSDFVMRVKNRIKRLLGKKSLGIRRWIESINSAPTQHSIDKELRDEMRAFFRHDVALLGRLLERDLFELWGWAESARTPNPKREVTTVASQ